MSIFVDSREYRHVEKVIEYLRSKNVLVAESNLDWGDFWIPGKNRQGAIIERKRITDLVHTVREGRYWPQMKGIKSALNGKPAVIIEGSIGLLRKYSEWSVSAVNSIKALTTWSWGIPVLSTSGQVETAETLLAIAKNVQGDKPEIYPVNYKPKTDNLDEMARFVVESLPGISAVRGDAILRKFGTVSNLMKSVESLDTVSGIGAKTKEEVIRVLEHRYHGR